MSQKHSKNYLRIVESYKELIDLMHEYGLTTEQSDNLWEKMMELINGVNGVVDKE